MNIKPRRGAYLVERILPVGEAATKAGLFIPPSAVAKHVKPRGKVIAAGGSTYTVQGYEIKPQYEVGETVAYTETSKVLDVSLDGKDYLLIPESEILYGEGDTRKTESFESRLDRLKITPEDLAKSKQKDANLYKTASESLGCAVRQAPQK